MTDCHPRRNRESKLTRRRTIAILAGAAASLRPVSAAPGTTLLDLVNAVRLKAKSLETAAGVQSGFKTLTSRFSIEPNSANVSAYSVARLLYDATRDAGFWNLQWTITNRPPDSNNIWRQWASVSAPPWVLTPTVLAECDELSALYAFLA